MLPGLVPLTRHRRFFFAVLSGGLLLLSAAPPGRAQPPTPQIPAAVPRPSKPDIRKAKRAFALGLGAEQSEDWPAAFEAYEEALRYAPGNSDALLHRELARLQMVQQHTDRAEREALAGRMDQARAELREALRLDPSYSVARERLAQFEQDAPQAPPAESSLGGLIRLQPQPGTRDLSLRGDTRSAYEAIAQQFGLVASFDADLPTRPVRFRLAGVDFETAMILLADQTGTFWRPLDTHTFFVAANTPEKRREFAPVVVRTVVLPAATTADRMTEILRLLREIAGVTHIELDTRSRTITLRDSPGNVAVAAALVEELERAPGEIMLEIEILEVDRDVARRLGVTPPSSAKLFTINPADVRAAQQAKSIAELLAIVQRVFGTAIPPLVAFGGGRTVFLATLPGAVADFSETLSLIRSGRRVLLRAQDGRPATFFVGDRFPIALALLGASVGVSQLVSGPTPIVFPRADFPTGNAPVALAAGDFNGDGKLDLAVTNHPVATIASGNGAVRSSNIVTITTTSPHGLSVGQSITISGVSDSSFNGTFTIAQVPSPATFTYAQTGSDATSGGGTVSTGSVSILLGNGDGTFKAHVDFPAGPQPTSVAVGDFNSDGKLDLAITNQGSVATIASSNGAVRAANVVTITTTSPHGFGTGQSIAINGVSDSSFNGTFTITAVPLTTTFTYAQTGPGATSGGGTVSAGAVAVLLGKGDGTFQTQTTFATGASPSAVIARDFDGDGKLDLAVTNPGSVATVASSNGTVRAASVVTITTTSPHGLSTGQSVTISGVSDSSFNGTFTIATVPSPTTFTYAQTGSNATSGGGTVSTGSVSILRGNGDGTFKLHVDFPVGAKPSSITAGDFNGDGKLDLVVANQSSNNVSVLLGIGDGTFQAHVEYPVNSSPSAVVTADFNADNKLDLAVANAGSNNNVSILLGIGDGTFNPKTDFQTGNAPAGLAVGDFNLDGKLDLAVANHGSNTISVLLGAGDGTFGTRLEVTTGAGPTGIIGPDVNADARPDIVTADQNANAVSVILNPAASIASSVAIPQTAYPGAEYEDLGVKVRATPRIHTDDEVTLQLEFEIRALSGTSINGIPVISNRTISQTVRLRENETTVLSGIVQREETRTITGLPGLARAPGVGHLAGRRNIARHDTELLIFLTPRQLRLAPRADRSIYAGRGEPATTIGSARPPTPH